MTMEWQPIDTAPKDGTNILICCWDFGGYWHYEVSRWGTVEVNETEDDDDTYEYIGWVPTVGDNSPTHWMPLPNPPVMESNSEWPLADDK